MFSDSIKGRNVVITGGSAGLGEQLAYQYAKLGANVFITARREAQLKQVRKAGFKFSKQIQFQF